MAHECQEQQLKFSPLKKVKCTVRVTKKNKSWEEILGSPSQPRWLQVRKLRLRKQKWFAQDCSASWEQNWNWIWNLMTTIPCSSCYITLCHHLEHEECITATTGEQHHHGMECRTGLIYREGGVRKDVFGCCSWGVRWKLNRHKGLQNHCRWWLQPWN